MRHLNSYPTYSISSPQVCISSQEREVLKESIIIVILFQLKLKVNYEAVTLYLAVVLVRMYWVATTGENTDVCTLSYSPVHMI